jgi:hypothetical protein
LQLVGACIFLRSESGTSYLALWPQSYRLVGSPVPSIIDGSGSTVPYGRLLAFGGGELDAKARPDMLSQLLDGHPPPAECALDLVWVVTELVDQR